MKQRTRPQSLSRLEAWALQLADRVGHNKAAVGLANKLVRISWAVWVSEKPYIAPSLSSSARPAVAS